MWRGVANYHEVHTITWMTDSNGSPPTSPINRPGLTGDSAVPSESLGGGERAGGCARYKERLGQQLSAPARLTSACSKAYTPGLEPPAGSCAPRQPRPWRE